MKEPEQLAFEFIKDIKPEPKKPISLQDAYDLWKAKQKGNKPKLKGKQQ